MPDVNFPLPNADQTAPIVVRLVRSAAYAAACPAAAVFTFSGAVPALLAATGDARFLSPDALRWLGGKFSGLHMGEVAVCAEAELQPLQQPSAAPTRFLAATAVALPNTMGRGLLVVTDTDAHAGLSPAQTYVLGTHAVSMGLCLDRPARGPDSAPGARTSTERLRLLESVVVNANDAVLITEAEPIDLPGPRIVYCNAAFTKTTGYTEAEVLGRTPRLLQAAGTDRVALDRLRRALERWEPVEVELLNVRKDGTEFWVELSIVPVADETGWFTHWVSVQRDVSHRKHAEEAAMRARIAEVEKRALEAEILQRRQTEERLLHAAFHDHLTHLRNRAYLMDRLALALAGQEGAHGSTRQCAVLFMDLDRFKLVNDSLGHRTGDLLLMEMAKRLQSCVRPQDTLARVGGDEFAVLIEGADAMAAAIGTAGRIGARLATPFKLGPHDVFCLCSIGIAQADPRHANAEELLRDADLAMYATKKRGSAGYSVFNESMHAGTIEALALQTDLRHALTRGEFHLHYQPIFDPLTLRMTSAEALVRWRHPTRGAVPPATFIPIAEEIGMVRDIDRWVLREACTQMRQWQLAHPGLCATVSVNVSGDELRDAGFIPDLQDVLRDTGLPARHLQIEITETVFLHQPEVVGAVLRDIRRLGARIAIDDFGTGYSSLGYLDRYELDTLKVDQSFVARLVEAGRTAPIVDAIVRLGATLGLQVVAEGVETAEQLAMLKSMGCGHVQGYLLGRPAPADELTPIFARHAGRAECALLS